VRGRAGLAVIVALVVFSLGGCGSDSDPSSAPTPTSTVAPAQSIGPLMSAYCEIQGLRQLIATGDVKRTDLPDYVDHTEVDGTPRIVDFTTKPTVDLDRFRDKLFASPGLEGVTVDRDLQRTCLRTTTDADIERTQGGPGYLANPSAEPTK
jgi:hypothetical protein